MKRAMSSFLFKVHAGHGFIEQDDLGFQCDGAGEFDALAQAIRKRAGMLVANVLDFEEVDDFFDGGAVLGFFLLRPADPISHAAGEAGFHQMVAADHDVIEHGHAGEEREILKGAANTKVGAFAGAQRRDVGALVQDAPGSRAIAAGDAIECRCFAGAVGANDRK